MSIEQPLLGKDVLITGATGVIGGAIAENLAAAGATVHLAGRSDSKLAATRAKIAGSVALPAQDLADVKGAAHLVAAFAERAKSPYGLVCAAGNMGTPGAFLGLDMAAFAASFNANFFAHAAMIQAFVRLAKSGHIAVFSGAGLGAARDLRDISSYSTAKAALTHFVEAAAQELPGFSLNALAPGAVVSGITEEALRFKDKIPHYALDQQNVKAQGGVPPTLAARLVRWLFTQPAPFVTGRLLAARFDTDWLQENAATLATDKDRFRMRRIDGTLFDKKPSAP